MTASSKPIKLEDAARYLQISKWTLYKLTLNRKIDFSKPNGKIIYFTQEALDKYANTRTTTAKPIEPELKPIKITKSRTEELLRGMERVKLKELIREVMTEYFSELQKSA